MMKPAASEQPTRGQNLGITMTPSLFRVRYLLQYFDKQDREVMKTINLIVAGEASYDRRAAGVPYRHLSPCGRAARGTAECCLP